jgi:hypothetical protein
MIIFPLKALNREGKEGDMCTDGRGKFPESA